jgi:geranylgeranyl diphosphate synthase type II
VSVSPALHEWLDAARRDVDATLERCLPSAPECPPRVAEAMRYSVFAGGKRLRPVLALAAAEAVAQVRGESIATARDLAMPAACALELIHTYSLVHDDLPAMDNDTMRRGRPTSHVVFGEGLAILAGDALLTEAFAVLSRLGSDSGKGPDSSPAMEWGQTPARRLRTIAVIAHAAGACGMVGGQAIDLEAAGTGSSFDAAGLRTMHARKTGALIRASASAGAIMAGAVDTQLAAIREYASELGLAFQIVDDVLDVEGASADLGKTAGKDAAAGKPTYPALYGLEDSKRLAAESIDRAITALGRASLAGYLPDIARWVGKRKS